MPRDWCYVAKMSMKFLVAVLFCAAFVTPGPAARADIGLPPHACLVGLQRATAGPTTVALVDESVRLVVTRKRLRASAAYKQFLRKYPRNAYVVKEIGELYTTMGRRDLARKTYADFLRTEKPLDADRYYVEEMRTQLAAR